MNDPAFFETAQALAKRMAKEGGPDCRSRVIYGYRLCTARKPDSRVLNTLIDLYIQELSHFSQDLHAAVKITNSVRETLENIEVSELAALTVVSNVLVNMDQSLTKD